jgi:hypothetical protein
MKKDTNKTKVIFRYWRDSIIAIFPEELGNNEVYTCNSYQHIGQHSTCDPEGITEDKDSRLATPEEYHDLKIELESLGYNLQIIKRNLYLYTERRREKLKEINS